MISAQTSAHSVRPSRLFSHSCLCRFGCFGRDLRGFFRHRAVLFELLGDVTDHDVQARKHNAFLTFNSRRLEDACEISSRLANFGQNFFLLASPLEMARKDE